MRMGRGVGRVGRPSLIGTAARTAVIAGTATAVSGSVASRQMKKAQAGQAQAAQAAPAAPAEAPAPEPAGGAMDEKLAQLQKLGELHQQGILTDEEFARQKTLLLG